MTSLPLLHGISHYALILRARKWHMNALDPGVSWYLVAADSPEQPEFKTYASWCQLTQGFRKRMFTLVENDMKVNKEEWMARPPPRPRIEMKIIEGSGVRLLRRPFRVAGIPFSRHLSEKSCPFKKRILPPHRFKYGFKLLISTRLI